MPKKNDAIQKTIEAIARIKDIKSRDPGDNEIFTDTIKEDEIELLDKLYGLQNQKPKSLPQSKKVGSEPKSHSITQKGNDKNGK